MEYIELMYVKKLDIISRHKARVSDSGVPPPVLQQYAAQFGTFEEMFQQFGVTFPGDVDDGASYLNQTKSTCGSGSINIKEKAERADLAKLQTDPE